MSKEKIKQPTVSHDKEDRDMIGKVQQGSETLPPAKLSFRIQTTPGNCFADISAGELQELVRMPVSMVALGIPSIRASC